MHPIVYFAQVTLVTFAPQVHLVMHPNVSLSTGVGVGGTEAVFPGPVSSCFHPSNDPIIRSSVGQLATARFTPPS